MIELWLLARKRDQKAQGRGTCIKVLGRGSVMKSL